MSINLALILTLLTAFTGVVYLLDVLVWKDTRRREEGATGLRLTLVEYSRSFFPVLLIVLVIRSFVFEPFRIPSGSMMPTLLQGDFIFVKKYSYGLRIPVTETKIIETGAPKRGDVVVFRLPQDPSVNYIKRVIGLPGDTVLYKNHRLTINGEPVELERRPDGTTGAAVYIEHLDDRSHDILSFRLPCEHHNVDIPGVVSFANPLRQFQAIHLRHLPIADDDWSWIGLEHLPCLQAVGSGFDLAQSR